MKKNILVTGAGALLGQGILRLLQVSDFPKKIFNNNKGGYIPQDIQSSLSLVSVFCVFLFFFFPQ